MSEGKLYIVPTPIGNLKDITLRALEVLKDCDAILAEDTRTSGKLLKHYEISTSLQSYHLHNEHRVVERIVERLKFGEQLALISDAGTPAISDPGFLLVRECVKEYIHVECLPGATAFVPALVNSGLPCDKFFFEGFLPHKKGRQTRWKYLVELKETLIIYESPHRAIKCLNEIKEFFGEDCQISFCRELSKVYEENIRGTVTEVLSIIESRKVLGEIVIIIDNRFKKKTTK